MNASTVSFNSSPTVRIGAADTPKYQQADHQKVSQALSSLVVLTPSKPIPPANMQADFELSDEDVIKEYGGKDLFDAFEATCEASGLEGAAREALAGQLVQGLRAQQSLTNATKDGQPTPLTRTEFAAAAVSIANTIPIGFMPVPTEDEADAAGGNLAALTAYVGAVWPDSALATLSQVTHLAEHDPLYATDPQKALERAAGEVLKDLRANEAFANQIPPEPKVSEDGQEAVFSNGAYDFKVTHGKGDEPPTVTITNRATGEETTVPCDQVDGAVRFEMENGTSIRIDTSSKDGKVAVDSVVILDPDEQPAFEITGFGEDKLKSGEVSADTLTQLAKPALTYYEQSGDQQKIGENWISSDKKSIDEDLTGDGKIGAQIKAAPAPGEEGSDDEIDIDTPEGAGRMLFLDKFCEMFGMDFDIEINGKTYHLGDNKNAPSGALNPDEVFKDANIFAGFGMPGLSGGSKANEP